MLTGRWLGDLYSRRKVFVIGVILFGVASAGCGLAGNIEQLIAARSLQGLGDVEPASEEDTRMMAAFAQENTATPEKHPRDTAARALKGKVN